MDEVSSEVFMLDVATYDYCPWSNVVLRWEDKVDRIINDAEERRDAKRYLLDSLDADKLCVIWVNHFAEEGRHHHGIVDSIGLGEVSDCFNTCRDWKEADFVEHGAAVRIMSRLLQISRIAVIHSEHPTYRECKSKSDLRSRAGSQLMEECRAKVKAEARKLREEYAKYYGSV